MLMCATYASAILNAQCTWPFLARQFSCAKMFVNEPSMVYHILHYTVYNSVHSIIYIKNGDQQNEDRENPPEEWGSEKWEPVNGDQKKDDRKSGERKNRDR